ADVVYGVPIRPRLRRYLLLALAAGTALALRVVVVGRLGESPPLLDNLLPHLPTGPRLLTVVAVIGLYVWRLVWPLALSADYSYPQIDAVRSPFAPAFLAGAAVVCAAVAIAVLAWRRNRHACFAIVLAALAFAPVSNLVVPIGTVMAERLL